MSVFEAIVYMLCLATSWTCAALLIRSYRRRKDPLLFWSAICFCLLGLNAFEVVSDIYVLTQVDLTLLRQVTSFLAASVLLFGLVWRSER